ncbi:MULTISPECIES: hypothetical protein [unclassified Crossiella]|uniref:hypothetical protein n=1 Tax=unclassified Crossiella TaxID=2620835 RepID=UPI001FFE3D59|nr:MULTISPECIES: hypothetical protein [unclassified Crossiella]MCK2240996.1 hypothetical protein [Crossiella sp. S99.2]MCK2253860.1 hypothetical protein [Crossiella sp. S99.1]
MSTPDLPGLPLDHLDDVARQAVSYLPLDRLGELHSGLALAYAHLDHLADEFPGEHILDVRATLNDLRENADSLTTAVNKLVLTIPRALEKDRMAAAGETRPAESEQ